MLKTPQLCQRFVRSHHISRRRNDTSAAAVPMCACRTGKSLSRPPATAIVAKRELRCRSTTLPARTPTPMFGLICLADCPTFAGIGSSGATIRKFLAVPAVLSRCQAVFNRHALQSFDTVVMSPPVLLHERAKRSCPIFLRSKKCLCCSRLR